MTDTDPDRFPHIYRAITKRSWYDSSTRRVSHAAFVLRKDESGLSVLKTVNCSKEICFAGQRDCFGEFILETARVSQLGLSIVDDDRDASNFSENHAEITNIPINPASLEEKKRAEDLASDLAEISSLYYDRYERYA